MEDFIFSEPQELMITFKEPQEITFFMGAGTQGPPGPPGPPGSGGASHHHVQSIPSATWTVQHNFGRQPGAVRIIQSNGDEVEGQRNDPDVNTIVLTFANARSGEAWAS